MEETIVALRGKHPAWGGRKLERRLLDSGLTGVPRPSTITAILRRHQLLDPNESAKHQAFRRFERAADNAHAASRELQNGAVGNIDAKALVALLPSPDAEGFILHDHP